MTAPALFPAAPPALRVTVRGVPAPQGSHKAFIVGTKGGRQRAVVTDDSKRTRPWKQAVTSAAMDARADWDGPLNGPVSVSVTFWLPRPKGHYGTGRNNRSVKASSPSRPAVKPDVDKLVRSCLDALGDAGVWWDDAQVVEIIARKVYADPVLPGAHIEIRAVS